MRPIKLIALLWFALCGWSVTPGSSAEPPYEVLPHRSSLRAMLWLSDGPALIQHKEDEDIGNRFRLGAELHFGENLRYITGWTFIDYISSAQSSESVGGITRTGGGPILGIFLVPDHLNLQYSWYLATTRGSRVSGVGRTNGHQLALNYQFALSPSITLGAEVAYLYVPAKTITVYDLPTSSFTDAIYPFGRIWTFAVKVGFDLGG